MDEFLTFRKMITPTIIQIVFWIGVAYCVIYGIRLIFDGLFIFGLIYLIVGPFVVRIYCELIILLFRIYDTLNEIKNNTNRG